MIDVFGVGFVGGKYCEKYPDVLIHLRGDYYVHNKDVLYFISTIDNYNIQTNSFIDIDTNLVTLMMVLDNWRDRQKETGEYGVFNFISSWFVYGNQQNYVDVKEDAVCNPKGFYSITKRTAEQLLISYCETFGLKYRILRLGNVLGKGDQKVSAKKNALQYLIGKLKANEIVELYNNGDFYRDYIHVEDVADAINLVITKGEEHQIYNVGNGVTAWRFRDIIFYARDQLESTSKILSMQPANFHKIVQVESFSMNIDKLKFLGYEPKYSTKEMIDSLL